MEENGCLDIAAFFCWGLLDGCSSVYCGKILRKNKQEAITWSAGTISSWDMRGVDGNGREYSWIDVDIKEIDKITLYNIKAKAESTKLKKMEQRAANSAEP